MGIYRRRSKMTWNPRPSDIEWTRNVIAMLKEGGSWVIPMTGQTFVKQGDKLILIDSMPADSYGEEAQADMFQKVLEIGKQLNIKVEKQK
jgi:hypothetical protein